MNRSSTPAVRNPLAADPEIAGIFLELANAHPAAAVALQKALRRLSAKCRADAAKAWSKHKGPIARYNMNDAFIAHELAVIYKSATVKAGHLARAIPTNGS
jgi:hypothetical protein